MAHRLPDWLTVDGTDVLVRVKVVPGASRDEIAGTLDTRLKIRTSAPPEGGRANRAVARLFARTLGVSAGSVVVESGQATPRKVIRVRGIDAIRVRDALG